MLSFLWGWVLERLRRNLPISVSYPKKQESHSLRNSLHVFRPPQFPHGSLQSLSQWSITSSSKSKTFACGLPKCLNSFPDNNLSMVTPIIFGLPCSLTHREAPAFQFKTKYQLYQTPLSLIIPSFLYSFPP